MDELQKRLDYFTNLIQEPEFLEMRGLGNEIPYYIFDYDPEYEPTIRSYVRWVREKISLGILEINLFHLLLDIYDREVGIEALLEMEAAEGTAELFDALKPTLEGDNFARAIAEKAGEARILFLTGVGSIYPLMRSHNILNRLHQHMTSRPMVMFYPGRYSGSDLSLFNIFKDDNYYRAFRIAPVS